MAIAHTKHRSLLALALVAACGGSQPLARVAPAAPSHPPSQASPPAPPAPVGRYDARTLFENVAVRPAGFSPDGSRVLASMDTTGVFNLYAIPAAGGPPERLTSSTESQFAVAYFPADDRVLYTQDRGGDELDHLHVLEPGGASRDLTPGDKLKALFVRFSDDDRAFWVATNERDPRAFDLYRYAARGYARQRVFENTENWTLADVSPDGRWLALIRVKNNADNDLYLLDLTRKRARPRLVTSHRGDVRHTSFGFSTDSKRLWYGTDQHGEFVQAWSCDLVKGASRPEITADWDVMSVAFSRGGRYRVSATNHDARTVLSVVDTRTGGDVVLPALPSGDVTGAFFSRDETRMGFVLTSDRTPRDVWMVELGADQPTQLTRTLNPQVDPGDLVDGEVVRYPSFDGLPIPALLFRPRGASADHKVPAIVWVHGGPGGQSRRGYTDSVQHLVNHGYAVLAVNNRGSSGYGKTFFHLDDRKHGDVDLKDCIWGRRFLESLDWVDGQRVAIAGGSYGGYMVVAALAFAPTAFDAGIDIFGVTNWIRTLESIPPWWTANRNSLYAELGDPSQDRDRLRAISPLFHARNIVRPLLVVQGANDPRVLKVESDEIVAAARQSGAPVEYLTFDDEGHGFLKRKNRIAAQEAFLQFLDRYLRRR